jgi:hypothetical protein
LPEQAGLHTNACRAASKFDHVAELILLAVFAARGARAVCVGDGAVVQTRAGVAAVTARPLVANGVRVAIVLASSAGWITARDRQRGYALRHARARATIRARPAIVESVVTPAFLARCGARDVACRFTLGTDAHRIVGESVAVGLLVALDGAVLVDARKAATARRFTPFEEMGFATMDIVACSRAATQRQQRKREQTPM